MKKKLVITIIAFCFSLGILSIAFMPFNNPASPLYSSTFDNLTTNLIVTSDAMAYACDFTNCFAGISCETSGNNVNCVSLGTTCYTEMCSVE